ncbi:MAG: ATP-binding protein [Bacteroidota bacterium]|nr:ATP-binding protein [Bacteroidota bacterium]
MLVPSIFLSLFQNTAILVSFILLYDYFWIKDDHNRKWYEQILGGLFITLIGIVLMLTPWTMSEGVYLDTRSILLSVSGAFLGPVPTFIAAVFLSFYRIKIGGLGVMMGISVIVSSSLIGCAYWYRFQRLKSLKQSVLSLWLLGIVVHIIMLGCNLFLPEKEMLSTIRTELVPVLVFFPLGTMLVGLIMLRRSEISSFKQKLIDSKALYSSLVNHMPAGVFRKTKDGRYDYVNERFCTLKGLTEEEIIGKNPEELADYEARKASMGLNTIPPISRARSVRGSDHHEWIIRHGMPVVVEEAYPQKDGHIEYFQVVKTPIFDAKGNVSGSQGMQFDISQLKQTEEALLAEQYLLKSFMDNTPDLIYFKDLESHFIRLNRAHMQLLGALNNEDSIGKTDFDYFTTEHARKAFDAEQTIIRTGKSLINIEEKETWLDGHITWVVTSKFPFKNRNGAIIGTFGVSKDITAQKILEQDLILAKQKAEESDRLKTAFLHNISHEIRTPMNAIVGFSRFLVDPDIEVDKKTHFAEVVVQSSNQLLSIIDNIVRIATIEAGQEKIQNNEMNLNAMMNFLYEQFQSKATEAGLEFTCEVDVDNQDATIMADETKLLQVLSNIIVNAFKFTKIGHVHMGYKLKQKNLEFYVEDTGIGIRKEMQENIFNRFSQVESSISRQYGGSGLGLSISKAYVHLLGGKIWVESVPGKGSCFRFTLPYHPVIKTDAPISGLSGTASPVSGKGMTTVLVAEDENLNFLLVRELLRQFDVTIVRAVNGAEAVELARTSNDIDLILMDLKMPVMDGYEATKLVKSIKPSLPVLALTAYSLDSDKNKALACGCTDVIVKPINKEELYSKLERFLKKHQ